MAEYSEKPGEITESLSDDPVHLSKRKLEGEDESDELNATKRAKASGPGISLNLLHLSDDVLLYILQHLTHYDLKALSFCCQRLRGLCDDRCLWLRAELRHRRLGERGLNFYVRRLQPTTIALCVRGYAGRSKSDKNKIFTPEEIPPEESRPARIVSRRYPTTCEHSSTLDCDNGSIDQPSSANTATTSRDNPPSPSLKENGNSSPKPFSPQYDRPLSPEHQSPAPTSVVCCANCERARTPIIDWSSGKVTCHRHKRTENPIDLTMSRGILVHISVQCPRLTELRLEYCNIDCNQIQIADFPRTLKILSLKASVCSNIPMNKSYLFKIQDYMPCLMELDLSWCAWLSAHSLLLLSKVVSLQRLSLRGCRGLGECVAYASLSARYGFKSLQVLDVRDTSMGDSETSSFSWISTLRELYMEPPQSDDLLPEDCAVPLDKKGEDGELEPWELEPPFEEDEEPLLEAPSGPPSPAQGTGVAEGPEAAEVAPVPQLIINQAQGLANALAQAQAHVRAHVQEQVRNVLPYRPPGIADIINELIAGNGDELVAPDSPPPPAPYNQAFALNEGRVHVIYVNVRRPRARAVRILVAPGHPQNAVEGNADDLEFPVAQFIPNYFRPAVLQHVPNRCLVTDASLLRLGVSDNLVHIGGNENGPSVRCCSLHVLVCRGYVGVTDRGLAHLAVAAPSLKKLDVSGTSVTLAGVRAFRDLRPDCQLFWKNSEVLEKITNPLQI